jgi:hypothetical protein
MTHLQAHALDYANKLVAYHVAVCGPKATLDEKEKFDSAYYDLCEAQNALNKMAAAVAKETK